MNSVLVERGAMLMAQMGAGGHLRIGARAFVGARAGLHKDVPAGARVSGNVSYGVIEMTAGAVIQGRLVAPTTVPEPREA